jgi:hypothetical protein
MSVIRRELGPTGTLDIKVIRAPRPPLRWRLRNALPWPRRKKGDLFSPHWPWAKGALFNAAARWFSRLTGIPTIVAELEARLIRADGSVMNYGVVSRRVVTDAGVAFLVDDWDTDAQDITTMNFHACGENSTAESTADTELDSEATTETNRIAGTKSQPAGNQLRSIGTQTFTAASIIKEHGLFDSLTEDAGVLWDRSIFAGIAVSTDDSIQWTYTCTINAGG